MLRRAAILLLAGTAIVPVSGFFGAAWAEDVTINLDALGPDAAKKQTANTPAPVKSEIVPDSAPTETQKPPAAKPIPATPKPQAQKLAPSGEIDFISRTKQTQGSPAPKPYAPVLPAPVSDEPKPAPQRAAAPAPKQPAAKKKEVPASVVVNSGGLEGAAADSKLQGTPLTSIQPDGVLYVPKNVEALPQPVSVPSAPLSEESESKPLTLPPALPDAPVTSGMTPPPPVAPAPPRPSAMTLPRPAPVTPPQTQPSPASNPPQPSATLPAVDAPSQPLSTQAVAAVAPATAAKPAVPPARASVLAGQATAMQVKFEPGLEILTSETLAALDQIAEPLKAGALRVQLAAYSGPPGNNSSDTRRLSLKRALAVRDYLDSRGVPKLTVNIAAFGGAVEGDTDRVDIMVRTDQVGRLSTPQ